MGWLVMWEGGVGGEGTEGDGRGGNGRCGVVLGEEVEMEIWEGVHWGEGGERAGVFLGFGDLGIWLCRYLFSYSFRHSDIQVSTMLDNYSKGVLGVRVMIMMLYKGGKFGSIFIGKVASQWRFRREK